MNRRRSLRPRNNPRNLRRERKTRMDDSKALDRRAPLEQKLITKVKPFEERFPLDNPPQESQPEEEEPGFVKKVWEKIKGV